ncbi:putative mitochondrial protein [Cucumis melo var. makuwa]|uniref:Putative mitochondrial protein n=1 Tax=Cucumis melo var. makuwa TaxID=1194695 RepID=A0A5D3DQ66_CUCMM|nr:putative mitochondrial protein [Cucumis melo var. makuwa]
MFVSQRKCTLDLLIEISMLGCRLTDTPIEFNYKLGNSGEKFQLIKKDISALWESLIYLSHIRSKMSYVVSVVGQFMQAPRYEEHIEVVNRILLKTTPGKRLMFNKTKRRAIETYTDFDWAGSVADRKSTSAIVHLYRESRN